MSLSQPFLPLFTALLAAQFHPIFRELACSFLARKNFEPARERPLVQSMSTAIRPLRKAASLPGLDLNRPPFTPGFVLEMFWTHRRFSNAAENPKWNENTLSKSGARTGRLQQSSKAGKTARRQDKARFLATGTSFLSFCLHIVFARLALCPVRCGGGAADTFFFVFNGPSGVTCDVLGTKDRIAYAEAR